MSQNSVKPEPRVSAASIDAQIAEGLAELDAGQAIDGEEAFLQLHAHIARKKLALRSDAHTKNPHNANPF